MKYQKTLRQAFDDIRIVCQNNDTAICDSMNCECGRRIMRGYFKCIVDDWLNGQSSYFLTIYQDRNVVAAGSLESFDILNARRSLLRYLNKANVAGLKALGFLDFMLRDFFGPNKDQPSIWMPHYHLIITHDDECHPKKAIRSVFPASEHGSFPVHFKKVESSPERIVNYMIKLPEAFKKKISCDPTGQLIRSFAIRGRPRQELDSFLANNSIFLYPIIIGDL